MASRVRSDDNEKQIKANDKKIVVHALQCPKEAFYVSRVDKEGNEIVIRSARSAAASSILAPRTYIGCIRNTAAKPSRRYVNSAIYIETLGPNYRHEDDEIAQRSSLVESSLSEQSSWRSEQTTIGNGNKNTTSLEELGTLSSDVILDNIPVLPLNLHLEEDNTEISSCFNDGLTTSSTAKSNVQTFDVRNTSAKPDESRSTEKHEQSAEEARCDRQQRRIDAEVRFKEWLDAKNRLADVCSQACSKLVSAPAKGSTMDKKGSSMPIRCSKAKAQPYGDIQRSLELKPECGKQHNEEMPRKKQERDEVEQELCRRLAVGMLNGGPLGRGVIKMTGTFTFNIDTEENDWDSEATK